jgi:DNA-binding MarR family transcriptional regulator
MAREATNELRQSPIHLLHRAGQCAENVFHAEMGERDLTPRQLAILMAVAEDEGANQSELVERTGIDRSTLADLVRRLQRKRLLRRHREKEDARAYAVKLTDEGRRLLRTVEPLAKRVDERVLDALPNKRRDQFMGALVSIVDRLQALSLRNTGVVRGGGKRSA